MCRVTALWWLKLYRNDTEIRKVKFVLFTEREQRFNDIHNIQHCTGTAVATVNTGKITGEFCNISGSFVFIVVGISRNAMYLYARS